ncbi:MAG: Type phosphodiesterase / nucleotide pyrophosphatase superfamily protein [Paenibacillaceae bacterium]|jgi:arylsulfatase A-like enzyme|nr:Type phosphodiesterase / nucleotide pyrophosphatase superfamily protein [Paenibacillaceae bacterium]
MTSSSDTGASRRVLVIGADGMRPDLVKADHMPNYAKLMKQGTVFNEFYAAYPPHTRVSMTTLTTGVYPGRHGVVANSMFVPGFRDNGIVQTGDDRDVLAFPRQMGQPFVLRPTLGDRMVANGKRLAISSSSSPGASLLWNVNHPELVINPSSYYEQPSLQALHEELGEVPAETGGLKVKRIEFATRVLIERILPDPANEAMMLWLTEPDSSLHSFGVGAPENIAALQAVDRCVGLVMEAIDRLGLSDQVDVLLISDHGHSMVQGQGSMKERINTACREMNIESRFIITGDYIYADPQQPWTIRDAEKLAEWLLQQPWCGRLLSGDPQLSQLSGVIPMENITGPAEHQRNPLLAVNGKWTDEPSPFGYPGTVHKGTKSNNLATHGTLCPYDLHAFCLGIGPSFIEGGVSNHYSGLVDIAPTVCYLLGLKEEQGFDGRVLTEGLKEFQHRDVPPAEPLIDLRKYW